MSDDFVSDVYYSFSLNTDPGTERKKTCYQN